MLMLFMFIIFTVVPSIARSQYDPDGVALDAVSESSTHFSLTTTTIQSTTIAVPTVQSTSMKSVNGTMAKRTMKKGTKSNIYFTILNKIKSLFFSVIHRNYHWCYCGCSRSSDCYPCWYRYFPFAKKVSVFLHLNKYTLSLLTVISLDAEHQQVQQQHQNLLHHHHQLVMQEKRIFHQQQLQTIQR